MKGDNARVLWEELAEDRLQEEDMAVRAVTLMAVITMEVAAFPLGNHQVAFRSEISAVASVVAGAAPDLQEELPL